MAGRALPSWRGSRACDAFDSKAGEADLKEPWSRDGLEEAATEAATVRRIVREPILDSR